MKRVVVVGGGVIGLCTALECARRGHQVSVIDREPARRGASLGNAGMIVPSHFVPLAAPGMVALGLKWMWNPESPFYILPRWDWELIAWALRFWRASNRRQVERAAPVLRDWHLASRAAFERLAADVDDFSLTKRGLLVLCQAAHTLAEEAQTAERARALGIPAEVFDARQTAAVELGLTMEIAGAVYYPRDAHLDPARLVAALEKRLRAAGVEFVPDTEVTGWFREGSRIRAARLSRGEIAGDDFVLAGGAWSPSLAQELGLRLPMQAGKGYSVTLAEPVERPEICAILAEARVAMTPMGGALRFGGTMELAGMDERINARRVSGIIRAACAYFPRFRPEHFVGIQPWSGLRPCSPDGLPYLGRTSAASNLLVATGHAMMGLSLAPVTGETIAQILDGEAPPLDLDLFGVDRFA